MVKLIFNIFIVVTLFSQTWCQFFGNKANLPGGGFNHQAGYKAGPLWGAISQSREPFKISKPTITINSGANFNIAQRHELGGNLVMQPGTGGQGSLLGKVNILDGPKHNLDVSAQHSQVFNKDLKPIGPITNSFSVNYGHEKGFGASIGGSHTHGGPFQTTFGASVPIISKPKSKVNVGIGSSVGPGMKPQHQLSLQAAFML